MSVMRRLLLLGAIFLAAASSAQALTIPQAKHAVRRAWHQQAFNVRHLHCRRSGRRVACMDLTQFPGVKAGRGVDLVAIVRGRVVVRLDWVR